MMIIALIVVKFLDFYGSCGFLVGFFFQFPGVGWDWVHLVRRSLIGLLHKPRMIDDGECGAVGGIRIGRGNLSTLRKPAPLPLCPPLIPHDMTWARTQPSAVGSHSEQPELWHSLIWGFVSVLTGTLCWFIFWARWRIILIENVND
jgi:hypothetical protein